MNGYQMTIEAYKQLLNSDRPDIEKEHIKSQIKALEPFAERTKEECIQMFDSGAFNDLVCNYSKKAMQNCNLNDEQIKNVIAELRDLFDFVSACDMA